MSEPNPPPTSHATLAPHLDTIVPRTLEGIHREYPNGVVIGVDGPGQWREPRERHPIFYGCYDWHSAVHSHWQLVRVLRLFPDHPLSPTVATVLSSQFTGDAVEGEMDTIGAWPGFEVPYGLAWVLQLAAELAEWNTPTSDQWLATLQPIVDHAADSFARYLTARTLPVRTGTHNQTAFALSLAYDWATTASDSDLQDAVTRSGLTYYATDRDAPLSYEPSAVDFLSPALAEADFMRRVMDQSAFSEWISDFLPEGRGPLTHGLPPQPVVDPSNGQLAHIAGLNMSRAWMAEGIASALSPDHRLLPELRELAIRHRNEGIDAALHADYMVSHWAPTFVVYLITGRGLPR